MFNLNAFLGAASVILSLSVCLFTIFISYFAIKRKSNVLVQVARYGFYANFFLQLAAVLSLLTALFASDLQLKYVVDYSGRSMEVFFKLTSLWAGSSGSYLLWNFLNSLFCGIYVFQTRKKAVAEIPWSLLILAIISAFFSTIAVFFGDAQPFMLYEAPAVIGRGLNPLLLHWAMIIHPPILYVGYVSFAIPFAIACGSLWAGKIDHAMLTHLRRWALFSWFFLGFGICLGMKWAYEELGWGGYWAWDPVENASVMPWFLCTAFIHSIVVQEKRDMLKVWNISLMLLTYHFCLLGTWITRSGVLEGPHSFANASFGTPFILFILASLIGYSWLLYKRRAMLKPAHNLESLSGKESVFLFNNFLLLAFALLTLVGVFHEAVTKWIHHYWPDFVEVTVLKENWYNAWAVPLGILVIFLMGIAPLLRWRRTTLSRFLNPILPLILLAAVVGTISYFILPGYLGDAGSVQSHVFAALAIGTASLNFFTVGYELIQGHRARRVVHPEEGFLASFSFLIRNKRRYGGYFVHIGISIMVIGFSGRAFEENRKHQFYLTLQGLNQSASNGGSIPIPVINDTGKLEYQIPAGKKMVKRQSVVYGGEGMGDKAWFGRYALEGMRLVIEADYPASLGDKAQMQEVPISMRADFGLAKDLKLKKIMTSFRRFHPQVDPFSGRMQGSQPTSSPDIWADGLKADVYIQLGAVADPQTDSIPDFEQVMRLLHFAPMEEARQKALQLLPDAVVVTARIWYNPLVQWVWFGAILMALVTAWIIIPWPFAMKKRVV